MLWFYLHTANDCLLLRVSCLSRVQLINITASHRLIRGDDTYIRKIWIAAESSSNTSSETYGEFITLEAVTKASSENTAVENNCWHSPKYPVIYQLDSVFVLSIISIKINSILLLYGAMIILLLNSLHLLAGDKIKYLENLETSTSGKVL